MDIEKIIELIIEGHSYRAIAKELNVPLSTLHHFVSSVEHFARVRTALEISAQTFDEKAEEILMNAEGTAYEMQRARELAQHYRWKSAKRNPRIYSEKVQTDSKVEITTIEVKPPNFD